jgi:hypothetical protein
VNDFWSRKLGGAQYGRSGRREYGTLPAHTPAPVPAPAPFTPAPEHYAPAKAAHLRATTGACPNCGSGDYIRPGENYKPRCYTCGYPVLHETSGMVATERDQSKVPPTRQLAMSRTSNFSPQTIIAKIGAV